MLMQKSILSLLAVFSFAVTAAYSQCTVSINPGDAVVCSGNNPLLTATAAGTFSQLNASTFAGNNHRGNMFDIVATNSVIIESFDVYPMGNTTVEVYYKTGTWNGFANSPASWTLIGSAPVVAGPGLVALPLPINIMIPAGQTYAFYVTSSMTSVSLNYSNGTSIGNVFSSDANISFLEGGGMEYPFTAGTGAVYQPRVWNGSIHYALANPPGTTLLWNTAETTNSIQTAFTASSQFTVEANIPGCPTAYDTVDLTVSIPLVSAGTDLALCSGDSLLLSGSGAVSYTWDNSITDSVFFTPAATLSYIVTGTDSVGCTAADTVIVTVNPLPAIMGGNDMGVCIGDTVVANANGGITYLWDGGITNGVPFVPSASYAYTVLGTDGNGCSASDTFAVTVNPLPDVSAGPDITACNGTDITLNGSGALTYNWSNGIIDGSPFLPIAGSYIVEGTDSNGCVDSDTMTMAVVVLNTGTSLTDATLMANSTGVYYQWLNCAGNTAIPGATNQPFTATLTGNYAVVVMDPVSGCQDTSSCTLIDFTGLEEQTASADFTVFPVPANDHVIIRSTGLEIARVELMDLMGQVLEVKEPHALQVQLDLTTYSANQFFVRIYHSNGIELMKVVKQ